MDRILSILILGLGLPLTLGSIAMAIFADTAAAAAPSGFCGAALTFWGWRLWTRQKRLTLSIRRFKGEAAAFFESVNASGLFPCCDRSSIDSGANVLVLYACRATLLEFGSGDIPPTFNNPKSMEGMEYFDHCANLLSKSAKKRFPGDLCFTGKGLVFSGDAKTVEVPYKKLLAARGAPDCVQVTVSGRGRPVYLVVPNGILCAGLARSLRRLQLQTRELPNGAAISLSD